MAPHVVCCGGALLANAPSTLEQQTVGEILKPSQLVIRAASTTNVGVGSIAGTVTVVSTDEQALRDLQSIFKLRQITDPIELQWVTDGLWASQFQGGKRWSRPGVEPFLRSGVFELLPHNNSSFLRDKKLHKILRRSDVTATLLIPVKRPCVQTPLRLVTKADPTAEWEFSNDRIELSKDCRTATVQLSSFCYKAVYQSPADHSRTLPRR